MNGHWIKMNAQAEMRANLRSAIKDAGLTQAGAATKAGVNYTHLTGFLSGNNWLTREAAEDFSTALCVDLTELVGGSIFKDDRRARTGEFDFMPPERASWQENNDQTRLVAEPEEGRTRAMCCECGTLRTTATKDCDTGWMDKPEVIASGHPMMLRNLTCATCRTMTQHAVLRLDENRNAVEQIEHAPTSGDLARRKLQRMVDRLAGFNVDVHFRSRSSKQRRKGQAALSEFDESKGRWRIEVDPNLPAEVQLSLLNEQWDCIATDDWGDVDWDPRDGTLFRVSQDSWDEAVDTLVGDIDRFLVIERRRMALDLGDQIAATGADASRQRVQEGGVS